MRRAIRFIAAFLGVLVLVLALLVWRVASRPITSSTLTPYVEAAIGTMLPNTRVQIARTQITWNSEEKAFALQADDVTLHDPTNAVIAEFPEVRLKLSLWGLLQGRFVPAELAIHKPRLWFVRHADGSLWFGGESAGGSGNGAAEAAPGGGVSFFDALRHFSREITRRGQFRDLEITDAALFFHDNETGLNRVVHVPQVTFNHGWISLSGQAKIEVAQKDHVSLIEARYVYDRAEAGHNVTLRFTAINPALLSEFHSRLAILNAADLPLSGEMTVKTDKELNVTQLAARVNGGKGTLTFTDFWDSPRPIDNLALEGSYNRKAQRLTLTKADVDFGGPKLQIRGEANRPAVTQTAPNGIPYDMAFTMDIRLTDLPMDSFGAVWPKPIIPNARAWIDASMSRGIFKQGAVTLRGLFAWQDPEGMVLESGEGTISAANGTVLYMDGMPRVEGVNAEAVFDLDHMDVKLSGGGIGAIRLEPSTVRLTDFQKTTQYIDLPIHQTAPVRDVVRLLDAPPLGYAKVAGLKPDDCEGQITGVLTLKMPLLKALSVKDIDIQAEAKLTGFGVKKIVRGMDLAQGDLTLNLDKEGFSLKGPAALNKVPLQLAYESRFTAEGGTRAKPYRLVNLNGSVTPEQWALLGVDTGGRIQGPVHVKLELKQPDKQQTLLNGEADLRQAAVRLDELAWKKPAGVAANLTVAAEVPDGKPIRINNLSLQGVRLNVKGTGIIDRESMRPLSLDLNPLMIGRTDAVLHFTQTADPKGPISFSASGKSFDVSGLTGGKDPGHDDPRTKEYAIKVDTLYTSEDGFLAKLEAHAKRDLQGWSAIELHGLADGGHPLDISLAPEGNKRLFSLTCDDFGKMLKGMGFTDTVRDGEIEVSGESTPDNPRSIEGTVSIGHFVVAGLPVLARLLSATSPFGLIDFVTGNASFDHLHGAFRWQGDAVELNKVRAAGSVFGLNINGRVDLNTGDSSLHGTLVPFSLVNRIIGAIPLIGDVITGGDGGGVLAVNYSVKGPLRDPDISVNPVSLLTPGFLRNLFFSDDGDDDAEPSPVPAPPVQTPAYDSKR